MDMDMGSGGDARHAIRRARNMKLELELEKKQKQSIYPPRTHDLYWKHGSSLILRHH